MVFPLLAAALPAAGGAATAAGAAAAASQAGMVLGGANIALGLGQTFLGYQAKQQQYKADKAASFLAFLEILSLILIFLWCSVKLTCLSA